MKHDIAVIAGDGIGLEVMPAALSCLRRVADIHGIGLTFTEHAWGSDLYRTTGAMMPVDGLDQLRASDAILLGAVGAPDIEDTETLWGLLIPIRREFRQCVNLRPARTLAGVPSLLARDPSIDIVIVRENNEGEYSEIGGRYYRGSDEETALQTSVFSRRGIERVARFAADLAASRTGALTSATKSNGIIHTMPFWDEVVHDVVSTHPADVRVTPILVDALAAALVQRPETFDVIVASNLLGDILSDLISAVTGSIGIAASGNLDPSGTHPSMFEPVHGSAPDIAGRGVANPIGQMWSGAMMLDHLGHPEAGSHLIRAFESVLASGTKTRDLGGDASTASFTSAVLSALDGVA